MAQGRDRILVEQRIAALGQHDRVDHHQRQLELRDGGSHRFDDRRGGEHAGLRRVDVDIRGDRFDLCGDKVGRHGLCGRDPHGVLRRDGGDGGGAENPVRGEGLEVGLDAGAAAGVAAGDGQRRLDRSGHGGVSSGDEPKPGWSCRTRADTGTAARRPAIAGGSRRLRTPSRFPPASRGRLRPDRVRRHRA